MNLCVYIERILGVIYSGDSSTCYECSLKNSGHWCPFCVLVFVAKNEREKLSFHTNKIEMKIISSLLTVAIWTKSQSLRTNVNKLNLKGGLLTSTLSAVTSQISSTSTSSSAATSQPYSIRVAYQGEPGAYSEKAARELLGSRVTTVNYESFEDAFKAVG